MVAAACREDQGLRDALAKRGIDDVSLVWVDPESITGFEPEGLEDRRLSWGTVWHRESADDNGYARPVAGLVPIIDLETLKVISIEDHGVLPMATEHGNYRSGSWGPDRPVAPLEITQPEGPGFDIDGQLVTWQNWSFRIGFTHREGMVLHDVTYDDHGKVRPIMKRAAINEMYVPTSTRTRRPTARTSSTGASTAPARSPPRWSWAATAWARSGTSTPRWSTATVRHGPSRTRSACTRRTTRSSGST